MAQKMKTAVWTMRFGYALVAVSLLLFVGLFDLVPVDLLPWLHRLWSGAAPSQHAYMRVVPSGSSNMLDWFLVLEWSLLLTGFAAIAVGRALKAKLRAE